MTNEHKYIFISTIRLFFMWLSTYLGFFTQNILKHVDARRPSEVRDTLERKRHNSLN